MTNKQIIKVFENMRLIYAGTSEPRGSINKAFRGYWMIPGENYEFRIILIQPRNNWAIEISSGIGSNKKILDSERGIVFIQNVICDKFELLPALYPPSIHNYRRNKLSNHMLKRLEFLMMYDITKQIPWKEQ